MGTALLLSTYTNLLGVSCSSPDLHHLDVTTMRLFPPHSLWSHTGAGHLACPLNAGLLRVSLFTSPSSPLLWKQVTGSTHVFQTRSHQGLLQPSWCLPNHPPTPVLLSPCIILASILIRPRTFAGLTKGASEGYLTLPCIFFLLRGRLHN